MAFSSVTVLFSKNADPPQSGWRQDLVPGNTVTCSLSSTIGITSYRWRVIGRPEGSAAGGAGAEPRPLGSGAAVSFTADINGTYIIECLINGGAPDATIVTGGCAILESIVDPLGRPLRLIGPGETDEDISDVGVAEGSTKMLNRWLRKLAAGGGGGGGTLAVDYNLGTSAADQTLTIADSKGGPIILDAQGVGGSFTGLYALRTIVPAGMMSSMGVGFTWSGGLELGPDNILIGNPGYPPTATDATWGVCVGGWSAIGKAGGCNAATAVGSFTQALDANASTFGAFSLAAGLLSSALGAYSSANDERSIAVGPLSSASGLASIAMGDHAYTDFFESVAIGQWAAAISPETIAIGPATLAGAPVGGDSAVAINAIARSTQSLAISGLVGTDAAFATAVGNTSVVRDGAAYALALGYNALVDIDASQGIAILGTVTAVDGISVGLWSQVDSVGAIAIGPGAYAGALIGGENAVAINGDAEGTAAVAIGGTVLVDNSIAIAASTSPEGASCLGIRSVGLGSDFRPNNNYDVTIGYHLATPNNRASFSDPIGDGYNVYVGHNIAGPAGYGYSDVSQVAIGADIGIDSSHTTAIGSGSLISDLSDWAIALSGYVGESAPNAFAVLGTVAASADSSLAIGNMSEADSPFCIALGAFAVAAPEGTGWMVVGDSGTHGTAGAAAIHQFIVRGYNGGAIDTLKVSDAPSNDYQTGLTIPYRFSGGAVAAEDVYAKDGPPEGALILYIPGPPS
jgi:hypothetical protein